MTIVATAAAKVLERNRDNISSHALISLLMAGGLERINQARISLAIGKDHEAEVLMNKIIAIVNGLRECLNFESGGEIAENLDSLYHYMVTKMTEQDGADQLVVIEEIESLLSQVKMGWDNMDLDDSELALQTSKSA